MCSYLIQLLWHRNSHSYSAINLLVSSECTVNTYVQVQCKVWSCQLQHIAATHIIRVPYTCVT